MHGQELGQKLGFTENRSIVCYEWSMSRDFGTLSATVTSRLNLQCNVHLCCGRVTVDCVCIYNSIV